MFPNPATLKFWDHTDGTPAPQGANVPFNQVTSDFWIGYDSTTGQVCITNFDRTQVLGCFGSNALFVGAITSEMINAAPANLDISFPFPAAKPVNKNVIGQYIKTFITLVSASGVVIDVTVAITGISFKLDRIPLINENGAIIGENFALSESRVQDVTITLQFTLANVDVVNPKDFEPGGVFGVWLNVAEFPTLELPTP